MGHSLFGETAGGESPAALAPFGDVLHQEPSIWTNIKREKGSGQRERGEGRGEETHRERETETETERQRQRVLNG